MMKYGLTFASLAIVESLRVESQATPIRKIVTLLEKSAKALEEEGRKEEDEYKKYKCWCANGAKELEAEIEEAARKAKELASKAEADDAEVKTLKQEIGDHKKDREDANAALKSATTQREKEHNAFVERNSEAVATIEAIKGAVAALEGGNANAFLQNAEPGVGMALQNAMENSISISANERDTAISLLMGQLSAEEASGSVGEVVGMLKQMLETEEKDIQEEVDAERDAEKDFDGLMQAKNKEVEAATAAIESKTERLAMVSVSAVEAQNGSNNSGDEQAANQKMLAEMKESCSGKDAEYEERTQMRGEEQAALQETISILGNDEALNTFNQGGLHQPGQAESFLQKGRSHKTRANKALAAIAKAKPTEKVGVDSLSLISSMIKVTAGSKTGADFTKVIKMIDDMVVLLQKEQTDDDAHLDHCTNEFHATELNKRDITSNKDRLEAAVDELVTEIANTEEEISACQTQITDLDKMVADATEDRKESNAEALQSIHEQQAMIDILKKAMTRLQAFYHKKEAATAAAADEEGSTLLQLSDKVAPPPAVFSGEYKTKDSNGPLALLTKFTQDAAIVIKETEVGEQNEQRNYETFMQDSADNRAAKAQSENDLNAKKAGFETRHADAESQHHGKSVELMNVGQYIAELHGSCDFLMENHDLRNEMRDAEIESLKNGKSALQGAEI